MGVSSACSAYHGGDTDVAGVVPGLPLYLTAFLVTLVDSQLF